MRVKYGIEIKNATPSVSLEEMNEFMKAVLSKHNELPASTLLLELGEDFFE